MTYGRGELVATEKLAVREERLLEQCEAVIKADLKAFLRVGKALATIKNEKLYRSEFLSFEEYVEDKWSMTGRYADYTIDANTVVEKLTELLPGTSLLSRTIVQPESEGQPQVAITITPEIVNQYLPQNEAQARELTRYKDNPEKLTTVWTTALATAPSGKVTAKHIGKTIRSLGLAEQEEKVKRARTVINEDEKTKIQSPQFKAAFDALWQVLNEESMSRFATTSKEAFRQAAKGILNIVGE